MAGPGGREVGRVSIRVVPDTEKFRSQTEKSIRRAVRGLEVKIPVVLENLTEVREQLRRLTEDRTVRIRTIVTGDSVEQNQSGTLRLDANVDTQAIQAELLRHRFRINVDVDLDLAGLRARLAAFRGSITVDVNIDMDRLRQLLQGLNNLGGAAGGASQGFAGMSARIVMLGLAIAALIPLIAGLAATLIAAIPSLVGMFGGVALVVGLGLDGIKESFKSFQKSIEPLRKHLAGWFEIGFNKAFKTIGDGLKQLENASGHTLGKMAVWIGGLFRTFANTAFIGEGFRFLNQTLNNTTMFLAQMQPVIETGTRAFLELAALGSQSFWRMGQVIQKFTDGFASFVARMSSSGLLDKAFEGLQIALEGLSDGFWKLMDAGVKVMAQIGPSVGRFFQSFGTFAEAAMPILGTFLNIVLDVASSFMDALSPALVRLQPAFEALGRFVGQLAEAIGGALGPVLEALAGVLGDILVKQIEAWLPVIPVLAESLGQFFQIIADFLNENSEQFATLMSVMPTLFAEILKALLPLLPKLLEMFIATMPLIPLFTQLVQTIAPIIERSLPILVQLLDQCLIPIMELAFWVLELATKLGRFLFSADGAREGLSKLGNKAQEVSDAIQNKISEVWGNITQWTQETWENFKRTVSEKIDDAKKKVSEFATEAVKTVEKLPGEMKRIGMQIIQGIIDGIVAKASDLWNTLGGIANGIKSQITNPLGIFSPSRVMRGYGKNISQGLALGIKDESDKPVKETKDLATRLRDAAMEEFKDFPKTLGNAWAQSISSDLGFGSSGAIGSLISQLMDPQVRYEDEKNIYVVKDLDDAERKSNNKKNKKALQYKPGRMKK